MSPINGDDDYGYRIMLWLHIQLLSQMDVEFLIPSIVGIKIERWQQTPFFIGSYHRIFDYLSKPHTMNFCQKKEKCVENMKGL